MRKLLTIIALLLSFCACRRNEIPRIVKSKKISWDIVSVNNISKSLVGSYDDLENACTPIEDGGLGRSIGFFAELEKDGNIEVDIFGTKETQLIYKDKIGSPQTWNYTRRNGEEVLDDLEWVDGATYHIRAYYPQSLHNLIEESTVARCFVMNYNTHKTQEDLLVAYNRVHTVDPITGNPSICINKDISNNEVVSSIENSGSDYGYSEVFDLAKPIPLFFQHSLAAIRVRFKFDYDFDDSDEDALDVDDELLNCYFTNIDNENGLHTTGALVYGNEETIALDHNTLETNWKKLTWKSSQSSMAGVPYYRWGLSQEDIDTGIEKGTKICRHSTYNGGGPRNISDSMAVAYTKYPTVDVIQNEVYIGSSSSTDISAPPLKMSLKAEAPYFNENDGWLLIIPQEAVSGLVFNFTTRRMGTVSTQVPPITMTDINGKIANLATAATVQNYYLPGYRYTYTLTISETDIKMELGVVDWNEINASEDIIF